LWQYTVSEGFSHSVKQTKILTIAGKKDDHLFVDDMSISDEELFSS